jgi:competence protein ComEC
MDEVIRQFPIGTFCMSFMPKGHTPTTVSYEKLLTTLAEKGIKHIDPSFGETFALGEATITILSGQTDYTNNNDQSVVCLVSHGQTNFLFMGDAGEDVEREILKARPNLKVDVLKVGHHGSSSSSDGEFIRRISPKIAVITSGYRNSYGHPHTETLQKLKRNSIRVYRSDLNGTVTLTSDGKTVTAKAEKEG